MINKFYSDFCT